MFQISVSTENRKETSYEDGKKNCRMFPGGPVVHGRCVCAKQRSPSVPLNTPSVAFTHSLNSNPYGLASYNPSTQVFSMTGAATSVTFPPEVLFCKTAPCPLPVLSVTIQVDNSGNLIGGNPTAGQPDFILNGQITNGATTYTSPLLTGQITQFYFDGVNDTPNFEFRFAVTGGSMAALYLESAQHDQRFMDGAGA